MHRYGFPAGGHLLIDFDHAMQLPHHHHTRVEGMLQQLAPDLLVGSRRVHQWANGREIHFAMRLSVPAAEMRFFAHDAPAAAGATGLVGGGLKVAIMLPDAASAPVMVKVGMSGVDLAGAMANLDAEMPDWDFERIRRAARTAWRERLDSVRFVGGSCGTADHGDRALSCGSRAQSLRRCGRALSRHGSRRPHFGQGEGNWSAYSLWDTYRAFHPLLTLIDPDKNAAFARNLARMTLESPSGPPVWPLQGIETHCMIGWHSVVVIAEALTKGAPGIDLATLWPRLRRLAFEEKGNGLEPYRRLGYVPADTVSEAASKTIEYSYDDWAMSKIAEAAGATQDAYALRRRSLSWRSIFDIDTKFVRPRFSDGNWPGPFDPRAVDHDGGYWRDFTECNAWQATFLAQHDIHGLMDLMGGDAALEAKLDALFSADSRLAPGTPPDVAGLVGQYAHGNEPSHHIAYLYAWCGAPWKTQARVRSLMATMYRDQPDGLAGNEDCGQMSAWFVLSAFGIYPVDPVSGIWIFGSPLFERVELTVAGGRLVIEAPGVSAEAVYVQNVFWNGKAWDKSWISRRTGTRGHLVFEMGTTPNREFGRAPEARPPLALEAGAA
jgi:predicted alpha-1,2-mannosidase